MAMMPGPGDEKVLPADRTTTCSSPTSRPPGLPSLYRANDAGRTLKTITALRADADTTPGFTVNTVRNVDNGTENGGRTFITRY